MLQLYKHFVYFLLIVVFLGVPSVAQAHLGGGPPFLRIDGKFAQTNPLNQGSPTLTIGWDVPPDKYFINKPLHFMLDVPVLMAATTAPQENAKDMKIRWSFATGKNFEQKDTNYLEGAAITKTFDKPGSYLTIIEAKLPADSDYILIDTVQVDIRPDESYLLPSPFVYIGTQFDDPKKNVIFVSEGSADKSTEIKEFLWDFGDGTLQTGSSINRKLQQAEQIGVEPIFHRIVDANGFVADVGFVAENKNNKLQFIPFNSSVKLPVSVGTYQEAAERAGTAPNKLSVPAFLGVSIVVLVLIGGVWMWVLKKK